MNLAEWADAQGIRVSTAYRWWREGTLPVPAWTAGRLILVALDTAAGLARLDGAGLYARVSSGDRKAGLGRQVARLLAWAAAAGGACGAGRGRGGVGGEREWAEARRLLADPRVTVVVEHRDRLGRMGTELDGAALAAYGGRLVVVDGGGVAGGLAGDVIEVLTWLCACLYGRGSARKRALKAVGCAQRDIGPRAVAGAGGASRGGGR